jgi:hypothetical protein
MVESSLSTIDRTFFFILDHGYQYKIHIKKQILNFLELKQAPSKSGSTASTSKYLI